MAGYGQDALVELRRVVAEVKADDPLAPVTVLVPNGIAGIVARRFLAQGWGTGSGVAGLYPTTAVRLAEQLAAHLLHPRRPATVPVVTAAWRAELAAAPGAFGTVAEHPATVAALVRVGRELRDLDEVALEAVAAATPLGTDVVGLHRAVLGRLAPDFYDGTDLLRTAVGRAGAAEVGTVVLYLPQRLSRAELALVTALGRDQLRVVAGVTGRATLDTTVLTPLGLTATDGAVPTAHRVLTASDADDEVRCVVRELVTALRTTPAHRVAVLYAAANPYARLLHDHLGAAGVTVNGPGTRPVHERAVARAVLELLDLPGRGWPRADLFRVLATVPMRQPDGDRIPVSRWERHSRAAGVVGGPDWSVRLTALAEGMRAEATRSPERAHLTEQATDVDRLRGFVTGLTARLDALGAQPRWTDAATALSALVVDLVGPPEELTALPAEEQYAAGALFGAVTGLAALDRLAPRPDLIGVRDAVTTQLEAALPRVGRFGDGVLVAPIAQGIGLDADEVFVVGLAEAVFPGRLREDPLLPERARDAAGGQLPALRERLDAQHRALLAAFASAPRVTASFPRGDLRTKSRHLPSRWLLPTLRALSGDPGLAATQWEQATGVESSPSFAGSLTRTPAPSSEQEWRTQAALAGALRDPVVDDARTLLAARGGPGFTRFDGDLSAARDGLPDIAAGTQPVSPTSLEGLAGCPYAYFVQRLLRVRPVEQPEDVVQISPADLGTLVHDCFDRLVTEFAGRLPGYGEPWSARQRARLARIAVERAAELALTGRTGHDRLWQQTLTRVQADLQAMLTADDAWRAEHRAAVVASELAFGLDGFPPVAVALPGGGRVLLQGRADKVDRTVDGVLHVTDIKTGGASSYTGLGADDPVLGGSRLQLPVYAHAARDRHGTPDTTVEAAYWFVRKDKGRITVPLSAQVEQVYAGTLETLVLALRDGQFPQRPPEAADFAWVQCPYCNPDGIGHADARQRWEVVRRDPALARLVALVEPLPEDEVDRP